MSSHIPPPCTGNRLQWVCFIPDVSVANLYNICAYGYVRDSNGSPLTFEWVSTAGFENVYDGGDLVGVLGHFGYGRVDDTGDFSDTRADIFEHQTFARGYIRMETSPGNWETSALQVNVVPVPGTAALGAAGLCLVGWLKRRIG
jgi:hypothetical protein